MDFEGFEALLAAADMVLRGETEPNPNYTVSYSDSSTLTAGSVFQGSGHQPWYSDSSRLTGNETFMSDCSTLTASNDQMGMEANFRNESFLRSPGGTMHEFRKRRPLHDISVHSEASSIERTRAGVLISSNGLNSRNSSISSGCSTTKRTRAGVMVSIPAAADSTSRDTSRSRDTSQRSLNQRQTAARTLAGEGFTSRDNSQRLFVDQRQGVARTPANEGLSPRDTLQRTTLDQRQDVARSDEGLRSRDTSRFRDTSKRSLVDQRQSVTRIPAGDGFTSRDNSRFRDTSRQLFVDQRQFMARTSASEGSSPRYTSQRSTVDQRQGVARTPATEGSSPRTTSQRSMVDQRHGVARTTASEGSSPRDILHRTTVDQQQDVARNLADKCFRSRDTSHFHDISKRSLVDQRQSVTRTPTREGFTPRDNSHFSETPQRLFVDQRQDLARISPGESSTPRDTSRFRDTSPPSRSPMGAGSRCLETRLKVENSTPIRKQCPPTSEISFGDISIIQKCHDSNLFALEDMYERFNSTTILFEESDCDDEDADEEKPGDLGFDDTAPEYVQLKKPNLREINHNARVHGFEYRRPDGTVVPARCIKSACNCTSLKCHENVDQISRKRILERFLELNLSGQNQLLAAHIDINLTERPQVVNSRRLFTRTYYLPRNGGRIKVCKLMFQATFDIGDKKTRIIAEKKLAGLGIAADDLRKNNSSHKTIPEEHLNFIKSHITSFPAYKSHYSSEKTEKLYLSSDLNIAKMYNLYLKKCQKKQNFDPVHYNSYRLIFKQFKLSFRKPKMDTCSTCDKFAIRLKVAESETETAEIEHERDEHQSRASAAYAEKKKDVAAARSSSEIRTASFDLQKCLATPYLQCGTAFYSRQLWTLNFTIFSTCNGKNAAHCHMWDESIAKRGSQEIGSCLWMDLCNMDDQIKLVTFYSDRCGGQNLNYVVCSTFLHFVEQCHSQGRDITIRHKFMTSGHSHMECDSIHASIEKAKKKCSVSIETPRDWAIFIGAINRKVPFHVIEMKQEQFRALKELNQVYKRPKKDNKGEKLCFQAICFFEFRSASPGLVHFKYNFDEDQYRCFRMAEEGSSMCTPGPIATEPLPLPAEKLEDLQKLLPFVTNKAYYETLLKSIVPKKRGRKPNSNVIDDFDGDMDDSVLFENEDEVDDE